MSVCVCERERGRDTEGVCAHERENGKGLQGRLLERDDEQVCVCVCECVCV